MKALIFDIDGTLWDTRALVARGYNIIIEKLGRPDLFVDAGILGRLFGRTTMEIADVVFAEFPREDRLRLILQCMEEEEKLLAADPCHFDFEGVVDTLRQLKKDYRIFLVSNCEKGYPELLIEKLGLGDVFEGHMCHGDTGLPKGDTILALMERFAITDAVYIGDTQGDLVASEKAGIPFIFCAYGFGNPDRYDAKLDSFAQLPQVLKTL